MPSPLAHSSGALRPLWAALLALGASSAWAETSPYYIGVNQTFSHSSNLFNSPDGQEIPDIYSSSRLVLGLDQPIGRQRLYGDASIRSDRYQDVRTLDNTGYGLNAGLDWATIERWSGNVKVASNRSLAAYGGPNNPQITEKNLQDTTQASLMVRNGLTPHVSLEGGAEHRAVSYSAASYQDREYTQNIGNFGVRYTSADILTLGAGMRFTKGKYPHFRPVGSLVEDEDRTDRRDFDLTANWTPSGLSKINARLSSTHETHSQFGLADVSGVTGQIGWIYQPTGKLTFNTALARDTGTETTFMAFTGDTAPRSVDNNRLTNSLSLSVVYELTAKIRLNTTARYSKASSQNDDAAVDDTASGAALGISWIPTRSVSLACNASRDKRTSTSTNIGSAYTTTLASCSAQLTLR